MPELLPTELVLRGSTAVAPAKAVSVPLAPLEVVS